MAHDMQEYVTQMSECGPGFACQVRYVCLPGYLLVQASL